MKKYWLLILVLPLFGFPQSTTIDGIDQDKTQYIADSLWETLSGKPDKEKVIDLISYGKEFRWNNPRLSMKLFEKAYELSNETHDKMLMSNALNGLAILQCLKGNNDTAISMILESIEYVHQTIEKYPDSTFLLSRLLSMHNNAGNIYQTMGEFDKSLQMHLSALSLADTLMQLNPGKTRYIPSYIKALNNTAVIYWNLGKMDKSMTLLEEALVMGKKHDDPKYIMFTLDNIGLIQIDREEYSQAIETYSEAFDLGQKTNDSMGIVSIYNNMGLIMEKLGNNRKALSYYLLSLQLGKRLDYSVSISNACSNLGRLYNELNEPDSALFFALKGIDEAKASGSKTYLLNNYETIYHVYEKMGKFEKALGFYKKHVAVKDSIFNTEKSRQIAEMEAKYETEKKEKENRILRQDIEIQQRTTWLLFVSLAAFIVVTVLLFYFYRLKNKALKQKTILFEQERKLHDLEKSRLEDQVFAGQQINKLQNEKLEQQNRELSSRILHAINKNEAMNNIIHELEQLKAIGNHDIDECFKKVSHIVKDNISLDKDWDQFKLHFEEVNPGFFYNLQTNYPDLTQHELRLCAYYRINLDTKEIARILSITPAAVQKSRHRLRKKMDILSEIELPEFMGRF
ncbi:MAG: hypothetical protein B6D64_08245 [Bacteroidetes bacterium 4484_276]|nr:MAG: hypothetical protein B6D64_08245 [Bacteroidetes bacterium 4484_276]